MHKSTGKYYASNYLFNQNFTDASTILRESPTKLAFEAVESNISSQQPKRRRVNVDTELL